MTGACSVTMNADKSVTAVFAQIKYTITGNAGAPGVTLSYTDVTAKTVTADGAGVYTISIPYGWSGTVTPSLTFYTFDPVSRPYTNVLSNQTAQDYVATQSGFTVTITLAGTGSGKVESVPSGIDCGATCTFSFPAGSEVLLIADPSATSTFTGWTGGGCTGTAGCLLTMDANKSITATFATGTNILKVILAGGGSVTKQPGRYHLRLGLFRKLCSSNCCDPNCSSQYWLYLYRLEWWWMFRCRHLCGHHEWFHECNRFVCVRSVYHLW